MTLNKDKLLFAWMLVASIFSLISVMAYATEEGQGAYIGGSMGSSTWSSGPSFNYSSSGLHLIGGYQITPIMAIEAEYIDLGNIDVTAAAVNNANVIVKANYKATGIGVSALGLVPIGNGKFSLYGKAGFASISTTVSNMTVSPPGYIWVGPNSGTRTAEVSWGLGMNYNITPHDTLRLSFDRYDCAVAPSNNEMRVDMYSIAFIYHF